MELFLCARGKLRVAIRTLLERLQTTVCIMVEKVKSGKTFTTVVAHVGPLSMAQTVRPQLVRENEPFRAYGTDMRLPHSVNQQVLFKEERRIETFTAFGTNVRNLSIVSTSMLLEFAGAEKSFSTVETHVSVCSGVDKVVFL